MKTTKEKAKELFDKMYRVDDGMGSYPMCFDTAKNCAIIAVDRNIEMLHELVNRMDDFSNESRQVIWQLVENEQKVKQEIEKL